MDKEQVLEVKEFRKNLMKYISREKKFKLFLNTIKKFLVSKLKKLSLKLQKES